MASLALAARITIANVHVTYLDARSPTGYLGEHYAQTETTVLENCRKAPAYTRARSY